MIIFPAIDLKKGQCVRLFKGDMNNVTVFNDLPSAQALEFQNQGFKYLHLVDLDGAIEGRGVNEAAVRDILKTILEPYFEIIEFREMIESTDENIFGKSFLWTVLMKKK